jgi:hypothetical protein
MVKLTRAKKRANVAAARTAAATKIQKFIRKRISHRLPVRPRPVIHHNPLANHRLLSLIAPHLSPANLRSLANATRAPAPFEVRAMQNSNVARRRREAAEVAIGRLPKIGPKPNYSIQMKMLRMIDAARTVAARNASLRRNAPNLNRRLAMLRNDILRKLNHRTTSTSHTHTINNNIFSRVNVGTNNNRGFIYIRNVLIRKPNNQNNNGFNWVGGSVNFDNFTNNGRNFDSYATIPKENIPKDYYN